MSSRSSERGTPPDQSSSECPPGIYLVATPIGNLNDITLRALDVLRSVHVVAAEDTRKTRILLRHFNLTKRVISFHAYNEQRAVEGIINLVRTGQAVAIVTDAGTPGIADPGYSIVRAAQAAALPVTLIPGPTAFVAALVLSGLPSHSFIFRGFPPHRPGQRRRFLADDAQQPHTLIYYESPHRLHAFLHDALAMFGDRQAAIASELTKYYERIQRGSLSELSQRSAESELRGEFTIIITGGPRDGA
ncbi:MAG: 16S rRNA (cytidine(1402)-2'-O)-methyltransferase [Chloroflexi bacterium]|nr:16S rRNA (cytidine(1402)-2'-O)-methyltransferase [Chloroflexota bacterium]